MLEHGPATRSVFLKKPWDSSDDNRLVKILVVGGLMMLCDAIRKIRSVVRIVVVNIVVFIVLVAISELILSFFLRDYNFYSRTYPGQYDERTVVPIDWAEKDDAFGWTLKKGSLFRGKDGVLYRANKQGFRDEKNFFSNTITSSRKRIMMIGDSYAFGLYLEEQYILPVRLQGMLAPHFVVYNVSMPGWGIDQMCLAFNKLSASINPDLVVFVYIDDDITRVLEAFRDIEKMNKPSFDVVGGKIVRREAAPRSWYQELCMSFISRSRIANFIYKKYHHYYAKKIVIGMLDDLIGGTKRKLLFVRYPRYQEQKNFIRKFNLAFFDLAKIFDARKIAYYDLTGDFDKLPTAEQKKLYLDEGHPSDKGCDYVAQLLKKFIIGNWWKSDTGIQ